MKEKKIIQIIFIIFLSLIIYTNEENDYCTTNFECIEYGCCKGGKCRQSSECKRINKVTYVVVTICGIIIVALATLYFYFEIKKTRKNVVELKKLDDEILKHNTRESRESKIEMFKKLGINTKTSAISPQTSVINPRISRIRK